MQGCLTKSVGHINHVTHLRLLIQASQCKRKIQHILTMKGYRIQTTVQVFKVKYRPQEPISRERQTNYPTPHIRDSAISCITNCWNWIYLNRRLPIGVTHWIDKNNLVQIKTHQRTKNDMASLTLFIIPKTENLTIKDVNTHILSIQANRNRFQHIPFFCSTNAHMAWVFVYLKNLQGLMSCCIKFEKFMSGFICQVIYWFLLAPGKNEEIIS